MDAEPVSAAPATKRPPAWRRCVCGLLIFLAVTYLAACVAIYAAQDSLIFYPNQHGGFSPSDVRLPFDDLRLTAADGNAIHAWYIPHDAARGTVIVMYGNASNMAEHVGTAQSFHRMGLSVLLFDYPGYGESTGKPGEASFYAAADAAWRYLVETRGLPASSIVMFGRSIGGAVAVELAARHPPAALIVESSFTSLIDMGWRQYPVLPIPLIAKYRFDSIAKVPGIRCPKLFFHGTTDEIVPYAMGRRLFDAAAEPRTFVEFKGGHSDGGFEYDEHTIDATRRWLDGVLPAPTSQAGE